MKRSSLLLAAAAVSISLISTGCANDWLLKDSAAKQGRAAAGVTLPELPPDCRRQEPHAVLAVGMEARVALRAERRALDRQNARTDRCATFYDVTKAGLEAR